MGWDLVGTIPGTGGGTGGWTDGYAFALELGVTDTLAAPTDSLALFADATYADTLATPTEALQFGLSGYAETLATPTEARDSLLVRWATTSQTSGTAPTNVTNAYGERNGTVAQVKAGGLANGASELILFINAPMPEFSPSGSPTIRVYYATTAGVADTFTIVVGYRKIGQSTSTETTLPAGNFLTSGQSLVLTDADAAQTIGIRFFHSATTPATGGNIQIDAVGVETTGAL